MPAFLAALSTPALIAALACAGLALIGAGYLVVAACALSRLRAASERAHLVRDPARPRPPVSLLVPLAGADPAFPESARSYLAQRYAGESEVLLCVLDPADAPGIEAARGAVASAPPGAPPARVVVGDGRSPGPNRKVANLAHGILAARHDCIAMADADMRPEPDFLERLVSGLEDPGVALSTSLYRSHEPRGLGGALEALAIDADFAPSVAVASLLEPIRFALGAAIALRRSTIDAIGGLAPLGDYIGEDYHLGRLVAERVGPIAIAPSVIPTHVGRMSLGAHIRHQLRWARTVRSQRPVGYAGLPVTNPLVPALAALALAPSAETLALAIAVLLLRVATIVSTSCSLGSPGAPGRALLAPLHDVIRFGVWVGGLLGGGVVWRGKRFRIGRDGRIVAHGS